MNVGSVGAAGFGDAQGRIAVRQDEVDRAVGQLRPHLARGLLGEIHRRLADGRGQRRNEVVDRLFDGDVATGQGPWPASAACTALMIG